MFDYMIENWMSIITVMMAVFGGIFALVKYSKNVKLRRAEFLIQIIEKVRFDEGMEKANRFIEYTPKWYDKNFHNCGENECLVVRLFSYYSYICYLIKHRYITPKDAEMFEYELKRTLILPSVKAYLFNLYHFSNSKKRKSKCIFQHLIDYGLDKGILPKEFKNKNCKKYRRILKF